MLAIQKKGDQGKDITNKVMRKSAAAPSRSAAFKSKSLDNPPRSELSLQRKCACGGSSALGECEECKKKRLQTKLSIGASNDPLEREADRVADQVLATPASSTVSAAPPRIQRFTGQATGDAGIAPPSVDRVLSGSGKQLDPAIQQDMGQRFGYDFSRVRVHTGTAAEQSAHDVNANAYTVGNNIVFGAGRFAPESNDGRRLIAHELTHVVQQNLGAVERKAVQRSQIYSGNILFEGDCQHLACNSRFACQDDANGVLCPNNTRNAGTKRRPLFTCDRTCGANQTCSDNGNWMAIPNSRFGYRKCDQDLVICANGNKTHASVRDKSEREAWEVSPGIQQALGVSGSFTGTIYSDESDSQFQHDRRCGNS